MEQWADVNVEIIMPVMIIIWDVTHNSNAMNI
jgi:hypothetical protein